jgi:hypothetical protein
MRTKSIYIDLLVLLLVLVRVDLSYAASFYLDSVNGNDTNTGTTKLTPLKTIAGVAAASSAGDTIYIISITDEIFTLDWPAERYYKSLGVTQYGVTWDFAGSANDDSTFKRIGRFVNGDYWVLGPVTINSISPNPSTIPGRNGSMINPVGGSAQGYDSRAGGYESGLNVGLNLPLIIETGQSLFTCISRPANDSTRENLLGISISMYDGNGTNVVDTAVWGGAVLTVLGTNAASDAFRPPVSGTEKPLFSSSNLRTDLLPNLTPTGGSTSFSGYEKGITSASKYARYFKRPCPMHVSEHWGRYIRPLDNCPSYYSYVHSIESDAALLLLSDIVNKEDLLINFIQYGIDTHYAAKSFNNPSNRGDRCLSKWPGMFAGIMLDNEELRLAQNNYSWFKTDDLTYYGSPWTDPSRRPTPFNNALFRAQRGNPYEHLNPFDSSEPWCSEVNMSGGSGFKSEAYRRQTHSHSWVGTALAARLMNAIVFWNHNAFFDYVDRWMLEDDTVWYDALAVVVATDPCGDSDSVGYRQRRVPFSSFTQNMWNAYRNYVLPKKPSAPENLTVQ